MIPSSEVRDDRVLRSTRAVSVAVIPVLTAAFVILYLFPGSTMRLWGWMVCPHMPALVLGGGYLAGAYFFTRAWRSPAWHEIGIGFLATTVFSSVLLLVTVLHWDVFNHDHVSFWAWLALYVTTPALLPVLIVKNRRYDPVTPVPGDVLVPPWLRIAAGAGGALQLAFASWMLAAPDAAARVWPWATDVATLRSISAFIAFPAVTWFCFLFEGRWSSFRITQQTATLGLALLGLGALRSRAEFRGEGRFALYLTLVGTALVLNVALSVAMERRRRRQPTKSADQATTPELPVLVGSTSGGIS